jgi:hypothetical protein
MSCLAFQTTVVIICPDPKVSPFEFQFLASEVVWGLVLTVPQQFIFCLVKSLYKPGEEK